MPYQIEDKFVIAVASSALFDLTESDRVFRNKGEDKYRQYQREHENDVLNTGVAFPLIKRLLSINDAEDQPVEVVLLSRNDPDTGLRVFKSIEHYKLPISRAVFVTGSNPFQYMEAFNASLFLSGNPKDVKEAVERGFPAGCIHPTDYIDDDEDQELRIAFDFDGVIADDSAESVFQEGGALQLFHDHERLNAGEPLPGGPLLRFFTEISKLQRREIEKNKNNSEYKPKIRVAIATARNAPAHERVITTLRKLDIRVDEAFFLGGVDKGRVLRIFKPHIFFDDQVGHIEGVARIVPSVHVPFGVTNNKKEERDSE
ncbi:MULTISPECIES: 5'-nucleotidase [unclassified Paenibacillus]|uniref:5'-nucleotidase n=1 Tax=unclassified Paenibacillus TaxID=185978 RepID=UPI001AE2A98F|nr:MULTISPECIES: 5'-nucleotidase [unclassified Paenibacillus]MBP1155584.1 5'-nucleotidase [Paenibacillus sp. PvP091]MBP1169030.1 5'-nucleotidase [Paenibacillus sp. PvR098]MBP2440058.1 5'-nucleotidase [Paenibacillus sp. PvP052]